MEDALKKEFQAEIELIAGGGGIYDIAVDRKNIFSKAAAGYFPEPAEIIEMINTMQ